MLMGYCCCEPTISCNVFVDNFYREEVGGSWLEVSGEWSTLYPSIGLQTNSSNALLECLVENTTASHYVTIQISLPDEGDIAGIQLADDLFVEVEAGYNVTYLRLYDSLGLIAENICDFSFEIGGWLRACYNGERFIGTAFAYTPVFYPPNAEAYNSVSLDRVPREPATGLKVGLYTGNVTDEVIFNQFKFEVMKFSGNLTCKSCEICRIWRPTLKYVIHDPPLPTWNIISGTWETTSANYYYELLSETTTPGSGLIESNVIHPCDDANGKLYVPIIIHAIEDDVQNIGQVFWPFNSGTSDSVYVEIKASTKIPTYPYSDTDGYIRLYDGTDLLKEFDNIVIKNNISIDVTICLMPIGSKFLATFTIIQESNTWTHAAIVTETDGRRIAFGYENYASEGYSSRFIAGISASLKWTRTYNEHDTGCERCLVEGVDCNYCDEGTTPSFAPVVLSGTVNNICPDCTGIDGEYVVEQDPVYPCDLWVDLPPLNCGGNNYPVRLSISLGTSGPPYGKIRGRVDINSGKAVYFFVGDDLTDCSDTYLLLYDRKEIHYLGQDYCDFSSATMMYMG